MENSKNIFQVKVSLEGEIILPQEIIEKHSLEAKDELSIEIGQNNIIYLIKYDG